MLTADDTIVAISTAAGSAARAIVRLSGPQAAQVAAAAFTPSVGPLADVGGFHCVDGLVAVPSAGIELPARAYVFRAPRSYTRQDVVELHIPGCPTAASALTSAMIEAGARQAAPGEFTARAFFSGRIDLSAAEAVADVINAAGDAQLRSALAALGGRVCQLCESAAFEIADILAGVEASIDLAEENIALDRPIELADRMDAVAAKLGRTAQQADDVPDTADRPHVVLAGRTNVGKSSLLNVLTGTERAIVSALAGTTRDVLSAAIPAGPATAGLAGMILQDAAGFSVPRDSLEAAADSAARRAVAHADVLLLVVDAAAGNFEADLALLEEVRAANARAPMLLLANKCDLVSGSGQSCIGNLESRTGLKTIPTSAHRGDGLADVRRELAEMLNLHAARAGDALGLHERQKRCLLAAAESASRAAEVLRKAADVWDVAELAAVELRAALAQLGRISGQVVTEDILARIFQRFCVGK